MYDREAIRAPSVARYALGVAVACERRRDSSRENVSNLRMVVVWRCEGSKGGREFLSLFLYFIIYQFIFITVCSLVIFLPRVAQILIMKNPIPSRLFQKNA